MRQRWVLEAAQDDGDATAELAPWLEPYHRGGGAHTPLAASSRPAVLFCCVVRGAAAFFPTPMIHSLKALMTRSPALTLAVAESLTCGHVQARVGAISGASNFFLGGVTAYTLDEKVRLLAVPRAAARRVNCVSAGVAEAMARGVCELFRSDLGIATTGYAEPSRNEHRPDPFAWWALAHRRRGRFIVLRSGRVECPGATRVDAQTMVADAVLVELLAYLEQFRSAGKSRGRPDPEARR